jgi:NAD+ synthase
MPFTRAALEINCPGACQALEEFIRETVLTRLRRQGAVVGLSGGIDSAVAAALAVRALGSDKVLGLLLPETHSSPQSLPLGQKLAETLGIPMLLWDISPILDAAGVYDNQRDAVDRILGPGASEGKWKLVVPQDVLDQDHFGVYRIVGQSPDGEAVSKRLSREDFRSITAATSMKQRTRMMALYYHAERLGYAVVGTTNRVEASLGFFVKHGDGGVDVEPLADLYKGQVFALARHLGVPQEILDRTPSPDTYSGEVSDEEYYFRMPYDTVDLLLYAYEHAVPIDEVAAAASLDAEQIGRAYRDFERKIAATAHLREMPPTPDPDATEVLPGTIR